MRDVQRFFFCAAEVYILSQYCGVKRVSTRRSRFSVKPVGHSHYGNHSRGTMWAHRRQHIRGQYPDAGRYATVGFSHYGTYSRGTRWLTAQSKSDVTVPMLRATRFAGRTALPSVP